VTAPEPVTVTRWRCPFCRRTWAHKKAATGHVGRCWRSPGARSCKTCAHFESVPDGDYCLGTPCNCNQGYEACHAGVDLLEGLKAGCPLWALRGPDCADCGGDLTVADLDGKRYCRVDAGRRMAAGEDVSYDEDPADGEAPRTETDCRGSGIYDCPCEADGPDGLCSCCRSGECNGSCAIRPAGQTASVMTATTKED
jgi:hypothetical protein